MKVYRASEGDPEGSKSWQRLRKGMADLNRRVQISQASNERYLESLAAIENDSTLAEATAAVCQRTKWKGRSVRALNPLPEGGARLLQTVNRGEFTIMGFRNRDLREHLFATTPANDKQIRSQTAIVTRLIQMLQAHGSVHKVPKSHRYGVSPRGRQIITARINARSANIKTLTQLAARKSCV